ncbi:ATP-grasp domain-containing protein [Halobacillus fulvus]|nr:ATP-grasp domain-containing protein [Halobacillus fulvus]
MEDNLMLLLDNSLVSPLLIQMALRNNIPIYYSDDERDLPLHPHTKASTLLKNKAEFRNLSAVMNTDYEHKLVSLHELSQLNPRCFSFPLVIKPNRGYSSVGVHIVKHADEWEEAVNGLYSDLLVARSTYQKSVIDQEQVIIEQWIDGDEYALDCYYDQDGKPVVLNILKRLFRHEDDTSDRMYFTSSAIVKELYAEMMDYLTSLNEILQLKNYPFHIEVRKSNRHSIVPIEMNPLRFAGFGTTDVSYYAYGLEAPEYYYKEKSPDWETLLADNESGLFGFFCAEIPSPISRNLVEEIDHDRLLQEFTHVFEYRNLEYLNNQTFAIIFFKAESEAELKRLLNLDLERFLKLKTMKEEMK